MRAKINIVFAVLILSVQYIYAQLDWKSFLFYEITDTLILQDIKPVMKVYSAPINKSIEDVDTANLAYSILIDDTKFSEYIMAALSHIRCFQKIQNGMLPNQFEVYRFHPFVMSKKYDQSIAEWVIEPCKTNLHSFGIGRNVNTGEIMLDVWINTEFEGVQSDIRNIPATVKKHPFILTPGDNYLKKAKFDYMIAGLINYCDIEPFNNDNDSSTKDTNIEFVKNSANDTIGLRFHSFKNNMPIK